MANVSWSQLEKKVAEIKRNTRLGDVSDLSIKQLRKRRLKTHLNLDMANPPLQFGVLQSDVFEAWLLTLEKRDGSTLSYSALNTHRAGLFNLYRDYGCEMPAAMEKDLRQYFKGLKREMATAAARGEARAKSGKDPLSFELYTFFCEQLLQQTSKDMIFARAYMVISWNLMCRSANTFGIRHGHLEWSGDALCVYFAHQKNDQEGSRPRDSRHIYTNPLRPAICPVLALAIFWATSSFDDSDRLFPGSNQYERFRKCLHRLLDRDCVAEELHRRGVGRDELGTHSLRKGAATYCASGSTACPSSTAVHRRAGWSLGGVQNTYLRYESAGDMHVGRTVSGLPPDSHEFAVLPPHFEERDATIETAIDCVFPGMPANLTYIGEFCLASLVFHEHLRLNIPNNHPLFESPLFQHPILLSDLLAKLRGINDRSGRLHATGVPPHVAILGKMK